MKFRVSSKDFIMFVIFCVFLLYLCAIAVLNFSSFANDGTFYGLSPFLAFTKDYIILTLFMFVIALVIVWGFCLFVCLVLLIFLIKIKGLVRF